ncbi:hypothetical protein [Nostoc sp.]
MTSRIIQGFATKMMEEHEDLIWTFIAEAKRHPQSTFLNLIRN